MKNIIGIFVIAVCSMIFFACDPVEIRNEFNNGLAPVTDAEISQFIKIEQQSIDGKKSNYFNFSSDGLKANVAFTHGLGTIYGTGSNGFIQCYVVPGMQEVLVTILNADASVVTKTYNFTIEECFNVAPEWAIFCGTGSKTWEWDVSYDGRYHGMGDVNDDRATWWNIPNPESRVAGEGVGATMTFTASGARLLKERTNGTTESGTFGFSMTPKAGYAKSLGQFTTSNATILAARNTKGGEVEYKFEIIKLTDTEMGLLVIDMDNRDTYNVAAEGWGQSTHWLFRAKK